MIKTRPYQNEFIDDIRQAMRRHKIVTAVLSTGAGKSILSSAMIRSALDKQSSSAFIVPRIDLLHQMSLTFDRFNIPHSFVAAGHTYDPDAQVYICSAGSLVRRLDKINPDVVFIDEAHISGKMADKIIAHYTVNGAWIVKLTATPKPERRGWRCSSTVMVKGKPMSWLIENNYLADYRIFAPSTPDLSGVPVVAGEYAQGALASAMERQRAKIVGDAITHYQKICPDSRAVLYAVSIKESIETARLFNEAGIPAIHMDADTKPAARIDTAKQFALGEIKVICNVDLITTGYDLASQCGMDVQIETVILNRPSRSVRLALQMIGRALRYNGGKKATILDHAGITAEHGLPDMEREWPLYDDEVKRSKSGESPAPVRQCAKCYYCHKPAPLCPNCGYSYPIKSRKVEHIEGELREVNKEAIRMVAKKEQASAKTLADLLAIEKARGYKKGWAVMVYSARMRKRR